MAHGAHRLLVPTQRARARARRGLGVALAAALGFTAISWVAPLAPAAQAVEDVVEQSVENSVDTPQMEIAPAAAAAAWAIFEWGMYPFVAGDESTAEVAFTVRDAAGNLVDANELIVVSSGPAQAVSAPRRTALGRYTATVSLGTVAGDFVLTASAGSVPLGKTTLRVLPASAQRMEVELDQTTLVADGASATSLRIRFFDSFGNQTAGTVERVETSGALLSTGFPFPQPDGSHLMRLRAGAVPGSATVTIVPKGLASHTVRLTLVQAPAETIEVRVADAELVADGQATSLLTAVVKNRFGQPVSGHELSVVSSDPGVGIGEVFDNRDGTYSAKVTASTVAGLVTLTATDTSVAPALSGQATFTQIAGPIASVRSGLSPQRITADGLSTTRLTVVAADVHGNPTDGRLLRVVGTDSGVSAEGWLTGQGDGTYEIDIRASKVAGVSSLILYEHTAPDMPLMVMLLEQVAGPAASLTAELNDATRTADGRSSTELRLTAADTYGNPVSGATFTASSSDSGVKLGRAQNRGDGTYAIQVTSSTTVGDAVITVCDDSGNPVAVKQVTLQQVVGAPAAAELVLSDSSLVADGKAETTLRAAVVDEHGNPVPGAPIGAVSTDAGQVIGGATESEPGVYELTLRSSTTPGVSTISVGTFLALADARDAGGLERVLATIELRQTAAGVTPEPRPEPKPGLTTNPEPGAPVAKPSVSPKLADSGAAGLAAPAGAAVALVIAGGAALMLRRGRRGV